MIALGLALVAVGAGVFGAAGWSAWREWRSRPVLVRHPLDR